MSGTYTSHRTYAILELGYTEREADEYALQRADEDGPIPTRRPGLISGQLRLGETPNGPAGQLGRDHTDLGGF